jgi:type IV pilus assembly protein PilZ
MGTFDDDAPRSERRGAARHAITLRVDYKRINTFFADYAKNISKGGTFIRTARPLGIGTEFVFVLSIPEQAAHLQLEGQVVWTVEEARATAEHPAGMGIRFQFASPAEKSALEDFVETLMAAKLGGRVTARLLGK